MPAARDNEAETTAALAGKDADSISEAISNMPAEQIRRICAAVSTSPPRTVAGSPPFKTT
ncbi:hypothetical protein [Pontibaca methylaminivorans]|uniref:hypothetical protein n=1 Tax=Pontibaca methylaminivorans TaxID=515897 RepID=UPI002FD9B729